jgi:predicted nucleic acid-binding Zn ribbon protein
MHCKSKCDMIEREREREREKKAQATPVIRLLIVICDNSLVSVLIPLNMDLT